MSKIEFKHDTDNFIEALGLPEGTTPESIDAGFQAFINVFSAKEKVSERMEFLLEHITDPNVLITVYHMVIHCLMQSQVAQEQATATATVAKKEESPIILPESKKIITPVEAGKETIIY